MDTGRLQSSGQGQSKLFWKLLNVLSDIYSKNSGHVYYFKTLHKAYIILSRGFSFWCINLFWRQLWVGNHKYKSINCPIWEILANATVAQNYIWSKHSGTWWAWPILHCTRPCFSLAIPWNFQNLHIKTDTWQSEKHKQFKPMLHCLFHRRFFILKEDGSFVLGARFLIDLPLWSQYSLRARMLVWMILMSFTLVSFSVQSYNQSLSFSRWWTLWVRYAWNVTFSTPELHIPLMKYLEKSLFQQVCSSFDLLVFLPTNEKYNSKGFPKAKPGIFRYFVVEILVHIVCFTL